MYEKLCDNLNFLMKASNINANELARKTGLPASTIKKIRNNDNPNPTLSTLLPIAKCFKITLSQLIGEQTFQKEDNETLSATNDQIKVFNWDQLNIQMLPETQQHPPYKTVKTITKYNQSSYASIIPNEFYKDFPKNTIILIDPSCSKNNLDILLVNHVLSNTFTLKQYIREDSNEYLKSLIKGMPIAKLSSEYKILGVIIEAIKYLKK